MTEVYGKDELIPVYWMAQVIGTAHGWGGDRSEFYWVFDFKPAKSIDLPACHRLCLNIFLATIVAEDEELNEIGSWWTKWEWVPYQMGEIRYPNPFYDFFEQA